MKQTWTVTLLYKFWSVSNILSFALSMSWRISQNSFNVKIFASITSPGTSSLFILQPVPHICLQDHLHYFLPAVHIGFWTSVVPTLVSSFFYKLHLRLFKFHFHSYHFLLFCWMSIFLGQFPLLIIHFWKNVMWHWETRRLHNYMLCWLGINWITDVKWMITNSLGKQWWDWSLITMCLSYLGNDFQLKGKQ